MHLKPMKKKDSLQGLSINEPQTKPQRRKPTDRKHLQRGAQPTWQVVPKTPGNNLLFILRRVHPKPQIMPDWTRLHELGSGSFGAVFLARNNEEGKQGNGELMAVKSAKVSCSESLKQLKQEAELLPKFEGSPHVIRCFGANETEENGVRLYNVFLEYASGGSLSDCIKNLKLNNIHGGGLPEEQVRRHTRSLLSGLSFIHCSGYVHCDIKPDNILLDSAGNVKIADFGLAMKCSKEYDQKTRLGDGYHNGTLLYMAPEILEEELYDPPIDIWALGCTVIEMITGRKAWDFPKAIPWCTIKLKMKTMRSPEIPKGLSKVAKDFVTKCLIVDPKMRWTAEMLLKHPFVAAELAKDQLKIRLPSGFC